MPARPWSFTLAFHSISGDKDPQDKALSCLEADSTELNQPLIASAAS
jgi:hypothetical protein